DSLLATTGFQGLTGSFDKDVYEDSLARAGYSPKEYEALIRKDAAQRILQNSVTAGANLPDDATLAIFEYIGETRAITYTRLNASHLDGPIPAPLDSELKAYYDANPAAFTQPLTRQITYISLTPELVAEKLDVSEDRIAELYEERDAEYNTPAKRFVERIVLGSMADATAARARIDAGELTFDALATERGLALPDIDLGDVTADDLSTDAAALLFGTEEPGIYGPVNTNIGPALFRLNAALSAQQIPLEAVRDELQNSIAIDDAGAIIAEVANEVVDLIAGGASLEEVAAETTMELGTIFLDEGSSAGIAAYSAFREEATAAEIGEERDIVDLEDGGIFALRVDEILEAFVKPLDQVTDAVLEGQQAQKTQELVLERATKLANAVNNSSANLSNFTFTYSLQIENASDVTRVSNIPDLPTGLIDAVFGLTVGEAAMLNDFEGAVVIELNNVEPFDPSDENAAAVLEQVSLQQSELLARDVLVYYGQALVNQAAPTINQTRIDSLHLQLQ
ncbi:MAG: peptidyl-prolyl cis-trans isomerase, partial [Alphaproteobacteria bacterium]